MSDRERVFVFGAGGHGKVVAEIAVARGLDVAAFIDDARAGGGASHFGRPVLSFEDAVGGSAGGRLRVALAIGNNHARRSAAERLLARGVEPLILVDPRANVSRSARLGAGAVVVAGACVNADAVVGVGALVNANAVVDHDCVVLAFAHVGPGAIMCGGSELGACAILGARSVLPAARKLPDEAVVPEGCVA